MLPPSSPGQFTTRIELRPVLFSISIDQVLIICLNYLNGLPISRLFPFQTFFPFTSSMIGRKCKYAVIPCSIFQWLPTTHKTKPKIPGHDTTQRPSRTNLPLLGQSKLPVSVSQLRPSSSVFISPVGSSIPHQVVHYFYSSISPTRLSSWRAEALSDESLAF